MASAKNSINEIIAERDALLVEIYKEREDHRTALANVTAENDALKSSNAILRAERENAQHVKTLHAINDIEIDPL